MRKKSEEYSDLGDSPNYEKKEIIIPNGRKVMVFVDADKAFEQGCKDFADIFSTIKNSQGMLISINKSNYKSYLAQLTEFPSADYSSARRLAKAQNFLGTYDLNRMYT